MLRYPKYLIVSDRYVLQSYADNEIFAHCHAQSHFPCIFDETAALNLCYCRFLLDIDFRMSGCIFLLGESVKESV